MSDFRIPEGVAAQIELVECSNCYSPTPALELAEGKCEDCRNAITRANAVTMKPELFVIQPETLPIDPDDELAARRALRDAVKHAAIHAPQGWLQHAVETLRRECVQGRHGHEFTVETILDTLERTRAPMPPQGATSLRFVLEQGVTRGWCKPTDRSRRGRDGGNLRLYRSCL